MLIAIVLLAGCEADNYESGNGEYSNMRADFADAHTSNAKTLVNMMTDDGDSLVFKAPETCDWATTPDSVFRALVFYNKVEGGQAEIIGVQQVLVPTIRPHYKVKEMKTDPLSIESTWKSRNNRYLNFGLNVLTGTVDDKDARQTLGMICDTLVTGAEGRQHLHLTMYHSQNNIPEYYTTRVFLSIPLKNNPYHLRSGDTVSVSVNTYEGKVLKTFVY